LAYASPCSREAKKEKKGVGIGGKGGRGRLRPYLPGTKTRPGVNWHLLRGVRHASKSKQGGTSSIRDLKRGRGESARTKEGKKEKEAYARLAQVSYCPEKHPKFKSLKRRPRAIKGKKRRGGLKGKKRKLGAFKLMTDYSIVTQCPGGRRKIGRGGKRANKEKNKGEMVLVGFSDWEIRCLKGTSHEERKISRPSESV